MRETNMTPSEQVDFCNQKCKECMEGFEHDDIPFDSHMCRFCQNGHNLHEALMKAGEGERKWGNIDWNTSRFGKYYGN